MSDKSQTKVALYAFLLLMLLGVLAPFALVGRATAPTQARAETVADLTPREASTAACKAFVRANAGGLPVSWSHVDEWQIFKQDSGNYKLFIQWTAGMRNYIRACTVQPVNGSWQVVSVK